MKKTGIHFPIVLASFGIALAINAAEPSYDGRPLSEWLFLNSNPSLAQRVLPEGSPAPSDAILKIGTNGIPLLLKILGATEKTRAKVVSQLASELAREAFRDYDTDVDNLTALATQGFEVLGTNAEPALPQLIKIFNDRHSEEWSRAVAVLGDIGPKGFVILTNAVKDTNPGVRLTVLHALASHSSPNPEAVRQWLIEGLNDGDAWLRLEAARSLTPSDPDLVIPVLLPFLKSLDDGFCANAVRMLSDFGPAAKAAAPDIFTLYTNAIVGGAHDQVKIAPVILMQALKKIDPDTAARAEEFMVNSGPINLARFGYTETRLKDGRELIAGGCIHTEFPRIKNLFLATAQLLDPATGKWTETGQMNVARDGHMAALLPSGKVLVAGGSDAAGHPLTSAELYDPSTGKWTLTSPMHGPHMSERMRVRKDGTALVYSGGYDSVTPITGSEFYDPTTETWTVVPKK